MENLVNLTDLNLFKGIYKGKKVLLTGHSGFKGSWLALWLNSLGANVTGFALEPPTNPNHQEALGLKINQVIGDIRDFKLLKKTFDDFKPDIIFHLAAQPLVRLSYSDPVNTFETNIMGSINVYEAARTCSSVQAIVSITSDKVYDNKEWTWGYRENETLGGKDPYSASKGAVEVITSSYRHSFFNVEKFDKEHQLLLATARAGNVIGGGDWAQDRLISDIVKASVKAEVTKIRSPKSTRPWQHVLEPLSGYLLLGQKLLEREVKFADSFNFGPAINEDETVEAVITKLKTYWEKINFKIETPKNLLYEADLLKLDCTKALKQLEWKPVWDIEKALKETIFWYSKFYESNNVTSNQNLIDYVEAARGQDLIWTQN